MSDPEGAEMALVRLQRDGSDGISPGALKIPASRSEIARIVGMRSWILWSPARIGALHCSSNSPS